MIHRIAHLEQDIEKPRLDRRKVVYWVKRKMRIGVRPAAEIILADHPSRQLFHRRSGGLVKVDKEEQYVARHEA